MPTYDSPGTYTYTPDVPVEVEVFGAGGARGDEGQGSARDGGAGGYVRVELDAGVSIDVLVAHGGNPNDNSGEAYVGGYVPGSSLPEAGDGGQSDDFATGGGGGGPTAIRRQSDDTLLAVADGGGGGAAYDGPNFDKCSGGGGARGGVSPSGGDVNYPGTDAGGSGEGGDGGSVINSSDPQPGESGGQTTQGGITVLETTTGGGNSDDAEVIVAVPAPNPPTNVSQSVTGDESIDVSWDGDDTAAEYEVEVSEDGGAFETVTTTPDTSIAYDAAPATNTHQFRVRGVNSEGTSVWVTTDTVATDPSGLTASGGTFDPIDLSWDSARDATEYRVLRTTDPGATADDVLATTGNTSYSDDADPSREYFYRIQAVYPGTNSQLSNEASARRKGLLADPVAPTTVALAWEAHADSTSGWLVEMRRQYDGGWGPWRDVTTTGPSDKQHEVSTSPGTTIEFRVTPVDGGADAPGTATITTSTLGLPPRNVHASGWHVEITRPEADGVAEPTILDDVTLNPQLNDKPEVVVPLPNDEQWLDERWERQPVRVWRDGERLPVERFADAEIARGDGRNHVRLYLRGGHDLDARYQDEVTDRSAHNVMRDVLEASGYAYTVDPAPATDGEAFATLSNREDFRNYADIDELIDPVEVGIDAVEPRRTAYLTPLPDIESAGVDIVNDATAGWTASNAVEFPVPESRSSEWTFETDYAIPAEHVGVWFRVAYDFEGYLLVYLDDQKIASVARSQRSNSKAPSWEDMVQLGGARTVDDIDDLSAGDHTLRIEVSDTDPSVPQTPLGPAGSVYLDVPTVFDTREWDPTAFATTLDSSELLDGPPGVYSPQPIDFRIQPIQRAAGATLDATVSDTSNDQAIGVGPIETDVQTNANATSIDRDFAQSTRDFIARVVLGGADGDGSGPNDGVEQYYTTYRTVPQSLDELAISYDALGSPSISESIDNPIQEVLTAKAQRANCIWELQWDADAGEPRVIVTQVGQRTSDANPNIAQYSVTKDLSRELSGATVYGTSRDAQGEAFTASLSGTDLVNDNLDAGSERVYDAGGTEYESAEEAGEETSGDYEITYQDGFISITDDGDMTAGQEYFIDYSWMPVGTAERDVGFDNHSVETLNAIRSDAGAAGAASFLLGKLDSPQWSAEVTIPQREAGFRLVDAIAPSKLPNPGDERFEIKSIDESAGEVSLTLGARQSVGDTLEQIQRTLGETAREV